ncbi:MAG: hypothetical protein ABI539_08760 [Acidobacteriota bacterium]
MASLNPQNLTRFKLRIASLGDTSRGDLVVIDDMLRELTSSFGDVDVIRVDSSGRRNSDGNIVLTGFAKYDLPFEGFLSKHLPGWKEHFDSRLELYTSEVTKFA